MTVSNSDLNHFRYQLKIELNSLHQIKQIKVIELCFRFYWKLITHINYSIFLLVIILYLYVIFLTNLFFCISVYLEMTLKLIETSNNFLRITYWSTTKIKT